VSDEPDPCGLRVFPAEPMRMWPISARVNKPENDDPSIVEPIDCLRRSRMVRYGFGVARPGALALLTFTALSEVCS